MSPSTLLAAAYAALTFSHWSPRPSDSAWNFRLVYCPPTQRLELQVSVLSACAPHRATLNHAHAYISFYKQPHSAAHS